MKKLLITGTKVIIFFVGWAVLAGLLPIPDFQNSKMVQFGDFGLNLFRFYVL